MGDTIFSLKTCRACSKKFRPLRSGREMECSECRKPPRQPRNTLPMTTCTECGKEFRKKLSKRDQFCSDPCQKEHWRKYRKVKAQEARDREKASKVVATGKWPTQATRSKPEPVKIPKPSGNLVVGRTVGGDEFLRLKQMYEARETA